MNPVATIGPNAASGALCSSSALSAPSAPTETPNRGPSVTVNLSDNAKAALAAANKNQDAANRILSFVDANRGGYSNRTNHGSRDWSDGQPSLEQEYQQLTGTPTQNPNSQTPSQSNVLTITLSESISANLSLESSSGAVSASAESTQSDSISLSVNIKNDSVQIVQSDQSQIDTTAQISSTSEPPATA